MHWFLIPSVVDPYMRVCNHILRPSHQPLHQHMENNRVIAKPVPLQVLRNQSVTLIHHLNRQNTEADHLFPVVLFIPQYV